MDDAWCGGCAAAGRWWLCIGCAAGERVHVVRDGMGAWEGGREGICCLGETPGTDACRYSRRKRRVGRTESVPPAPKEADTSTWMATSMDGWGS